MDKKKARLIQLVRELSYEKREVTLASGRKSNFYIDGKQTTLHPEGAALIGEMIMDLLEEEEIEVQAVGGPTMGADPMVAAVAVESFRRNRPLPAFIIRKTPKGHGTGQWIEGLKNLKEGMSVAIIEDTVTTGGSALEAAKHAEEAGLKIAVFICMCDRQEGARQAIEEAGYLFHAMITRSDLEG